MAYDVVYTENVIEFILAHISSERVYDKVDSYRFVLSDFPEIGTPYQPYYPAARPPFSCRWVAVPDTPFTLYYLIEIEDARIVVFYIEHQSANPQERFDWSVVDL